MEWRVCDNRVYYSRMCDNRVCYYIVSYNRVSELGMKGMCGGCAQTNLSTLRCDCICVPPSIDRHPIPPVQTQTTGRLADACR